MSRLINKLSPNPRLQRTRSAPLRSPLSRKTFGDSREMCGAGQATIRVAARTRIVHPFRPGRRRAEISPQECPALASQRFPTNASSGPLNSTSAQAYRPAMSRLINQLSPNPRLQRTRSAPLRSPLSRKPLGGHNVQKGDHDSKRAGGT